MPAVLVNKPVVKPTEKDEIVQIGGPAFRPVEDVMNLKPMFVVTSVESTRPSITVMD